MPFWLHTSKTVLTVSGLSLWQKLTGSFALVGFAGLIGLCGFYLPLDRKWVQVKQNLETLLHQKKLFQQGADCSSQAAQLHVTLNQQMKELITKSYTPQKTMGYVLEIMQRHGISCRSIKPKSIIRKHFYEKHYILIGGRGSFHKILTFLRELENNNVIIACKTLLLRKDSYRDLKFQLMVRVISVKDM